MARKPKATQTQETGTAGDTKMSRFDAAGIDEIAGRIEAGETHREIAESYGASHTLLWMWLRADPNRSARAREAHRASAKAEDDLALEVIRSLPKDATPAQVAAMREEAQHRRWRARVRNPDEYGDRIKVDADIRTEDPEALRRELAALAATLGPLAPTDGNGERG